MDDFWKSDHQKPKPSACLPPTVEIWSLSLKVLAKLKHGKRNPVLVGRLRAHVAECVIGVFAFDDGGRMISSEHFPKDPAEVATRIANIQSGTPSPEHRKLVGGLVRRGYTDFTLESPSIVRKLQREFRGAKFEPVMPNLAGTALREKLSEVGGDIDLNIRKFAREVCFALARRKLRVEASRRDNLIIQTISLLDEIDKFSNILAGMIREWYSNHFPELDDLIPEHQTYLKLIVDLGSRENFSSEGIKAATGMPHEEAEKIANAALNSLGAQFDELDTATIRHSAREVLNIYELRGQISAYIDEVMEQVAPNLRAVVGGSIGARLISLAGGLERLSRMPASTMKTTVTTEYWRLRSVSYTHLTLPTKRIV